MERDNSSSGKPHYLSEEEYADWISIDANLEVVYKPNEEDICAELMHANVDNPAESDSNDEGGVESDDWSTLKIKKLSMGLLFSKRLFSIAQMVHFFIPTTHINDKL